MTWLGPLLMLVGGVGTGWAYGWVAGYQLGLHRGRERGRHEAIIGSLRERQGDVERYVKPCVYAMPCGHRLYQGKL